jgi:hypothetical protein
MRSSLIWRWFAWVPMPDLDRLASVLTIVNASYQEQLDEFELVACLSDFELAKQHSGHVSSFLGEVPVVLQVEFALTHGLAPHRLASLATRFSEWSGETYPLTE